MIGFSAKQHGSIDELGEAVKSACGEDAYNKVVDTNDQIREIVGEKTLPAASDIFKIEELMRGRYPISGVVYAESLNRVAELIYYTVPMFGVDIDENGNAVGGDGGNIYSTVYGSGPYIGFFGYFKKMERSGIMILTKDFKESKEALKPILKKHNVDDGKNPCLALSRIASAIMLGGILSSPGASLRVEEHISVSVVDDNFEECGGFLTVEVTAG